MGQYGLDILKYIDLTILENFNLDDGRLLHDLKAEIDNSKKMGVEVSDDAIKKINKDYILLNMFFSVFDDNSYFIVSDNPELRALVEDYIIDFGSEYNLRNAYIARLLSFSDLIKNFDLFKNKKFIFALKDRQEAESKNITEDKIEYIVENFNDIAEILSRHNYFESFVCLANVIDIDETVDYNREQIYSEIDILIKKSYKTLDVLASCVPFSRYSKAIAEDESDLEKFEKILKYSSDEKISSYNIPAHFFENYNISNLFALFGIDTIMEFDKSNNGFFSNNDFENLELLYTVYINYDYVKFNKDKSILHSRNYSDDNSRPFTPAEFEEAMFRVFLYGPTDLTLFGESKLDLNNISEEFTGKYIERYVNSNIQDENNREKIIKVFSKYKLKYIKDYLISKDLENTLRKTFDNYNIPTLVDWDIDNLTEEELNQVLLSKIRENMVLGNVDFTEDEPDIIKENFPEFFLSKDAPDILKHKFYRTLLKYANKQKQDSIYGWYDFEASKDENYSISVDDLANEDYITFLKGKSLKCSNVNNPLDKLIDIFDTDELIHIINYGFDNLEDTEKYEQYKVAINKCDYEEIHDFIAKYPLKYIEKFSQSYLTHLSNKSQTQKCFEASFLNDLQTKFMVKIIKYSEHEPNFVKERFPELFLDKSAPEELKNKFYTAYQGNIELVDLSNPEYVEYLKGKSLTCCEKTRELFILTNVFSLDEVIEFANIGLDKIESRDKTDEEVKKEKADIQKRNIEILNMYSRSIEIASELKNKLSRYSDFFAKKEIANKYKIVEDILEEYLKNEEIQSEYNKRKDRIKNELFLSPGLVLYYDEQHFENMKISEYDELKRLSKFKLSGNYRLDLAEQILGKMYGFLGYGNCRAIFEVPTINEDVLDNLIKSSGELAKNLYEEKFKLVGNCDIAISFFRNLLSIAPGDTKKSKEFWNIAKSINQKLISGYSGDIGDLLNECYKDYDYELNETVLGDFENNIRKYHTKYKLDLIKEHNSYVIENSMTTETPDTRKKLKMFLNDAIRYSFDKKEKIDLDIIKAYLEKEFSETNEEGNFIYSYHITDHLNDLLKIAENDRDSKEYGEDLNKTIIDVLTEEAQKIGKGWIRKLVKANDLPEKLSVDEFNSLETELYGESDNKLESRTVIGLRDGSTKGLEKAFQLLADNKIDTVLTFEKAEKMFSALTSPYSEEFCKFFMKNKDKFLGIPEYYNKMVALNEYFDSIISDRLVSIRYNNGQFKVEDVMRELNKNSFLGVEAGYHELAYVGRKAGWNQEKFKRAKEILDEMKNRESQAIPPEEVKKGRFRGRILRIDDPLALAIGDITNCCQCLGKDQPGESSMMHSILEENGSVFVVEELDEYGEPIKIISQSWVWRNGNRVCFDNVEIPDPVVPELKKLGAYDEILDIYQEAGKAFIDTDKKALLKLLDNGKITEEQYKHMQIKEVTIGTGIDDLISNISRERRKSLDDADISLPLEMDKDYKGMTTKHLYSDARGHQVCIVNNKEADISNTTNINVSEYGIRYKKIREIQKRTDEDINSDMIEKMKQLNKKEGLTDNLFSSLESCDFFELRNVLEETSTENEFKLAVSMSETGDWYILTKKEGDVVSIEDSLIGTKFDDTDLKSKNDKKMAFLEYSKELLLLFQKSFDNKENVKINLDREGKFANLEFFIQSGIIEVSENGTVKVADLQKLKLVINDINESYEQLRKDRILEDIAPKEDEQR